MVAEFRDTKLATEHPSSSDDFEEISGHARGQVDGAKVVFDTDVADLTRTQTDFIDDGSDEVSRLDPVDSTDFDPERFAGTLVPPGAHRWTFWSRIAPGVSVMSVVTRIAIEKSVG